MIAIKRILFAVALAVLPFAGVSQAQFIRVETPLHSNSDSFFERTGVGFGFHLRGGQGPGSRVVGLLPNGQLNPGGDLVFGQNSVGSAVPPFGGFDPNTQGTFGFGTFGSGGGFSLALFGGKGNNRSSTMTAPSVVVPNGGIASIFSGAQRPFVTGITPILGDLNRPIAPPPSSEAPTYSNPSSTAMQGDISIDEINRLRALRQTRQDTERLSEIHQLITDADDLTAKEKFGAARAKYSRALRKIGTSPEFETLREAVSEKLSRLEIKR